MAKPSKETLAIDIGSSSVKFLVYEKSNDTILIKDALIVPTFDVNNIPKTDSERHDAIVQTIRKAQGSLSYTGKAVHTAVSGQSVIVRYIFLPKMSDIELRGAIRFEAENYIPFNINDVVLDFQIMEDQSKQSQDGKIRVLLAAVKKDVIDERIRILSDVGLEVEVIDVDAFALMNAFELNYGQTGEAGDGTYALVNIGANMTNINIVKGKVAQFSRDIALGGFELTRAIQKKLSLGFGDAEELKVNPGNRSAEIVASVDAVLKNLVNEIRLSFDYYENQIEKGIDMLYVSGGCVAMQESIKNLQETIDIDMKIWDPFEKVTFVNKGKKDLIAEHASKFPVAVGLAAR